MNWSDDLKYEKRSEFPPSSSSSSLPFFPKGDSTTTQHDYHNEWRGGEESIRLKTRFSPPPSSLLPSFSSTLEIMMGQWVIVPKRWKRSVWRVNRSSIFPLNNIPSDLLASISNDIEPPSAGMVSYFLPLLHCIHILVFLSPPSSYLSFSLPLFFSFRLSLRVFFWLQRKVSHA